MKYFTTYLHYTDGDNDGFTEVTLPIADHVIIHHCTVDVREPQLDIEIEYGDETARISTLEVHRDKLLLQCVTPYSFMSVYVPTGSLLYLAKPRSITSLEQILYKEAII